MIHSRQAVELVKNKVKTIRLEVSQKEYDGESHNVIAGLPGKREEFIVLTAHYDSTSLSHGAYDNMSGCAGLLGIMEAMKDKELNYGLRFVFCGSEERGLLGSKAYVLSLIHIYQTKILPEQRVKCLEYFETPENMFIAPAAKVEKAEFLSEAAREELLRTRTAGEQMCIRDRSQESL